MRIAKLFTAAATSVALMATPAVAASQASAQSAVSSVGARAGVMSDADDELFRGRNKRRGGFLVFILIAVVIAVGIYIIVDDEDDEDPVSA